MIFVWLNVVLITPLYHVIIDMSTTIDNKTEENMKNLDLRIAIKDSRLKCYEVAKALGMAETSFSRMMRYELTEEKKAEVLKTIEQIISGEVQ
jgi:hypothetical protein